MTEDCAEKSDPFAGRKTINVVLLGLVFMLLASRTPISIVKTVLYSATDVNSDGYIAGFNGDGYVANAILYSTFAVSNFLAPWVISNIGPKYVHVLFPLNLLNIKGCNVFRWVWLHPLFCPDALPF